MNFKNRKWKDFQLEYGETLNEGNAEKQLENLHEV